MSTAVAGATREWTIVRIESDDGQVGWGEACHAPGLTGVLAGLGEALIGADLRQVQPLIRRLHAETSGSAGGIVRDAISGVDAALWDLNARLLGVPLWRLLGGRVHERVRVYARCSTGSLCNQMGYEQLAAQASAAVAAGFDGLKIDLDVPGLLPRHPGSRMLPPGAEDLASRIMTAVRRAVGPYVDVAYDCNRRYDLQSAMRLTEVAVEQGVWWLEDPVAAENVDGLRSLVCRAVPLGGGEHAVGYDTAARLLETGALSVLTPDLRRTGGYAEVRRMAEAADRFGVALAPHTGAGPIGTAFAAQVACTWPNLLALEYSGLDVRGYDDLVGRSLLQDGAIEITDRPGIGVEPDLEVVGKDGEGFFSL
ncbi:mandelate racemase/muconate lactonizing enzyme family protein [Lentzea nigeriaca]|uniref:mandelate racemase/muconate lactonizing enzyme family protein n=1 Tax=Lentzea nigeriaca TaxID=1128665 RepID=UPI00195EFDCC|nr:mandelate racemase/muconate lactonizing enzyme family protein [Lentzea nigeriaca]MBM7856279.1 L-alanine-DL-glutamate epimerase-like enolase superfamily enzyme [Lentzea nigeriaca]